MIDQEVERDGEPIPSQQGQQFRLSEEQKKKINLIYVNMGHISNAQMLSLLKAAGAKPEVLQFVQRKFSCEQC